MTYLAANRPSGGGGIPVAQTTTNLSGIVDLVTEQQNRVNRTQPFTYIFTLIRGVDALSPRLQSAMTGQQLFPFVDIETPSGHMVTLKSAQIQSIEKIVRKGPNPNPGLGPLEAVTYTFRGALVDGVIQNVATYDWYALNP